jgi:ribosome-associated toxin RatA of RatAB toxin-antitoxin module
MEVRRSALVEFPAERMFDLIEAAEHYPAFMPWCRSVTIVERDDAIVAAEIHVDYHGARFTLATRNPKRRPTFLGVHMERGPFRRFEGEWHLTPLGEAACKIEFTLHYELGRLAGALAAQFLDRFSTTVVDAFVVRADHIRRAESAVTLSGVPS